MKAKIVLILVLFATVSQNSSCQTFKQLEKQVGTITGSGSGSSSSGSSGTSGKSTPSKTTTGTTTTNGSGISFSQNEAAQAIKDALTNGITNGVKKVSVTDGYFKNMAIKIPFPQNAQAVESALRGIGMNKMVDDVVLSLNRAAESAANKATPIFVNSIKQMTITDAINIVNNKQQDAATQFLQRTTTEQLVVAFKPSIKTALDKVNATKYWNTVMTQYNKIPFVSKVETDLPEYVTRKAISGLFYMIAQEEAKIRKDPVARTSEILKKVFGGIKL